MLLAIATPPDNHRGPRYMQEVLAALHQANHERLPATLELSVQEGRLGLYVRIPDELESLVAGLFAAKYPACAVKPVKEEVLLQSSGMKETSIALQLIPDLFPILRHSQFEDIQSGTFS